MEAKKDSQIVKITYPKDIISDIKMQIKTELLSKSDYNESDSYCCLSEDIMNILINIISGYCDDAFNNWCKLFRNNIELTNREIENNYAGIQCMSSCCNVYYNNDMIYNIKDLCIYK
jgi:hypothetical protein